MPYSYPIDCTPLSNHIHLCNPNDGVLMTPNAQDSCAKCIPSTPNAIHVYIFAHVHATHPPYTPELVYLCNEDTIQQRNGCHWQTPSLQQRKRGLGTSYFRATPSYYRGPWAWVAWPEDIHEKQSAVIIKAPIYIKPTCTALSEPLTVLISLHKGSYPQNVQASKGFMKLKSQKLSCRGHLKYTSCRNLYAL